MKNGSGKILFIINKRSGRKNTNWKQVITDYFNGRDEVTDLYEMPDYDCRDQLKTRLKNFLPDLVVAVGGDGTVTLVARLLMDSGIPMAIIPAGSANGMARELEIPEDPQAALDIALTGEVRSTDVIRLNKTEICLHLSDIGLNARLVKYFQEGNLRGKIGYAFALIRAFNHRNRMNVWVRTGDSEVLRSAVMVLIANASKYGTGATINPQGSIYDGKFEVVIVRRLHISEILKMFKKFQRFNPRKIEVFQTESVRMETSRPIHFQVDGEYIGKISKVKAEALGAALKLVIPRIKKEE